jgi:hypothetical protein
MTNPTRPFAEPRDHVRVRLAAVAAGSEPPDEGHRITYRESGGPPGKRLETIVSVDGTGRAHYEHLDELVGKKRIRKKALLGQEEVAALLQRLYQSPFLTEEPSVGFLPDSVVGSITLEAGGSQFTRYFLADQRQRERQGKQLTPGLRAAHALVQELHERIMKKGK